ncbi:MAG TPA: hypothetical protein VFV88_17790 [Steroidobacteraceae bacterium]|jgi:hypothetical protein|nr:hypothetical protein [Steroidobacteraceae bacterium]
MLANLRALFGGVVDITLFRSGPESLPASQALLAIVVVLFIAVSVVMSALVSLPVADALAGAVLGSVVMLAWFRAALAIANKRERFLQTCTAIFGVNLVFQPALVPLAGALKPYFEKADPTVAPPAALMLVTTVLGIWAFIVEVRIVKAAFEVSWLGGVLLIIGEFFAAVLVSTLLFGTAAKGAA